MTLTYENNALLPRGNGKTLAALRSLQDRITDMIHQHGIRSNYKIIFVVGWNPESHKQGIVKTYLHRDYEFDKVIVMDIEQFNNMDRNITNSNIYDIIIDTSILSVSGSDIKFKKS